MMYNNIFKNSKLVINAILHIISLEKKKCTERFCSEKEQKNAI